MTRRRLRVTGSCAGVEHIDERGTVTVSGTIEQPRRHPHQHGRHQLGRRVDSDHDRAPGGQDAFSTPHTYLNNPPGVGSENFPINARTNQHNQTGHASASVTVSNVAPQFTAADLSLSKSTATEGDTVTLNGQFTDPGTIDPHTVTIDWGDGSPPTVLSELAGQVVATATPGLFTYSPRTSI